MDEMACCFSPPESWWNDKINNEYERIRYTANLRALGFAKHLQPRLLRHASASCCWCSSIKSHAQNCTAPPPCRSRPRPQILLSTHSASSLATHVCTLAAASHDGRVYDRDGASSRARPAQFVHRVGAAHASRVRGLPQHAPFGTPQSRSSRKGSTASACKIWRPIPDQREPRVCDGRDQPCGDASGDARVSKCLVSAAPKQQDPHSVRCPSETVSTGRRQSSRRL